MGSTRKTSLKKGVIGISVGFLAVCQAQTGFAAKSAELGKASNLGVSGLTRVVEFNSDIDLLDTNEIFQCLGSYPSQFAIKSFGFDGRCKSESDDDGCYYYDYRKLELTDYYGFDQRGVESYQVTFPNLKHKWAALAIKGPAKQRFCWSGGAHVGRNPLAMTWSGGKGNSGTKNRKNNFLLSQGGQIIVEGARVHNIHDAFLADTEKGGYDIRHTWVTWNRDDFYEGYLHNLSITDSLIDGTYTFISDPDGECNERKQASDRKITIRDSLIRLQRQPGPYARHTEKWHWSILGGHDKLWKLDSCGWSDWPKFELINNVFFIDGPPSTRSHLTRGKCNSALPGDCLDKSLSNIADCKNNLFIYKDFKYWTLNNVLPGPTPAEGHAFFNSDNPDYLPNGLDCYQRITDDPNSPGYENVNEVWQALRSKWIARHSDISKPESTVMQIPGVDYSPFRTGTRIKLINYKTQLCAEIDGSGAITAAKCINSEKQILNVENFDDGKLSGALLLKDYLGRYIRTQSQQELEANGDDSEFDTALFAQASIDSKPAFTERWYMLPKADEPEGVENTFVIESDALRRSYLIGTPEGIEMQHFYGAKELTPSPQSFDGVRANVAMHWIVQIEK